MRPFTGPSPSVLRRAHKRTDRSWAGAVGECESRRDRAPPVGDTSARVVVGDTSRMSEAPGTSERRLVRGASGAPDARAAEAGGRWQCNTTDTTGHGGVGHAVVPRSPVALGLGGDSLSRKTRCRSYGGATITSRRHPPPSSRDRLIDRGLSIGDRRKATTAAHVATSARGDQVGAHERQVGPLLDRDDVICHERIRTAAPVARDGSGSHLSGQAAPLGHAIQRWCAGRLRS
jgi:hypothetical protein